MKNKIIPYILAVMIAIASIYSTVGAEFTMTDGKVVITSETLSPAQRPPYVTKDGTISSIRVYGTNPGDLATCDDCLASRTAQYTIDAYGRNMDGYTWIDVGLGGYDYIKVGNNEQYGLILGGLSNIKNDIFCLLNYTANTTYRHPHLAMGCNVEMDTCSRYTIHTQIYLIAGNYWKQELTLCRI